jgi:hypothetical protein
MVPGCIAVIHFFFFVAAALRLYSSISFRSFCSFLHNFFFWTIYKIGEMAEKGRIPYKESILVL